MSSKKNQGPSIAQFILPPYEEVGHYRVGLQILTVQQANPLEISVWYPADSGSGYPYALHETCLDEGAKILAFADIISALTEEWPCGFT